LRYLRETLIEILKISIWRKRIRKQIAKLVYSRKFPAIHGPVPHDRD
jgi:hypothetical protein